MLPVYVHVYIYYFAHIFIMSLENVILHVCMCYSELLKILLFVLILFVVLEI